MAAVLALGLILGGQVSELFDHWDNTLKTGKDIDYPVVTVAAAAGFVTLVPTGIRLLGLVTVATSTADWPAPANSHFEPSILHLGGTSPPLLLRI